MSGRTITAAVLLAVAAVQSSDPAAAQKSGGTLRAVVSTNLPSASIHEELTIATVSPFTAVFNNLLLFDQGKPRNSTMVEPNWRPQLLLVACRTGARVTVHRLTPTNEEVTQLDGHPAKNPRR